jgi:hypothetical protein
MTHSLPFFYGSLFKVKTVENVIGGNSMKEFLQVMMVAIPVLALFMVVRFAIFMPLHNETMAVKDPAPVATANRDCVEQQANTPCLQHTDKGS